MPGVRAWVVRAVRCHLRQLSPVAGSLHAVVRFTHRIRVRHPAQKPHSEFHPAELRIQTERLVAHTAISAPSGGAPAENPINFSRDRGQPLDLCDPSH